jgi:hypothetical protein
MNTERKNNVPTIVTWKKEWLRLNTSSFLLYIQMTNILIGATGSVAAIKIPLLVSLFKKVYI